MPTESDARTGLVTKVLKLAEKDGLDLDRATGSEFMAKLDGWVLSGRLPLPEEHPFRRGFVFDSETSPGKIMQRADEEASRSHTEREGDGKGDPVSEEGPPESVPRKDPPIFGEEIEKTPKRIVVLVPGILGSQITLVTPRPGKPDELKIIWPPLSNSPDSIAPIDQLVDTGSSAGVPGAPVRKATVLRPAYEELIQRLNNDGYSEQRGNLVLFGYDWTKSCRANGTLLAALVKSLAQATPDNPTGTVAVDVICHSMGGLLTRTAIRLESAPVRRTAYLASPHHGAPKAYFALHPSAPAPLAAAWWKTLLINHLWNQYSSAVQPRGDLGDILRALAIQFPSVYELLPDEFYFQRHHIVDIHWKLGSVEQVTTLGATYYTTANVCFPRDGGMQTKVQDAMRFKSALQAQPPGDHIAVWSNTEETNDRIVYEYNIVQSNGFLNPTDTGQRGDGTVPTDSAKVGQTRQVTGSHTGVPNSQETYDIVAAYLELKNGQ